MNAPAAAWQLDRLSTSAREAAETASHDAGLPLSSWLTQVIDEACAAEGISLPEEPAKILEFTRELRERAPAAVQPRSAAAAAPIPLPLPPAPPPNGATMLPLALVIAADLGTRRGEDVPAPLLADIATRGVRQPITVRRSASHPERYEVICGYRRWRAAQRIGLVHIPALIVSQDDAAALLASLHENLQRGDLSALDEAQAYLRLLTHCAVDASAVSTAIGRDRKHIVQSMRLLGLPPLVRHLIGSGMLSHDHAYLLLDAPHPETLADAILAENLSVEAARARLAAEAQP
ncbi:MAG TPA: ParB/RepB/Spo0J family partition protein [Stellaceae bacterium]|jgi:ParB/RepB/Spo0J family partition protein